MSGVIGFCMGLFVGLVINIVTTVLFFERMLVYMKIIVRPDGTGTIIKDDEEKGDNPKEDSHSNQ